MVKPERNSSVSVCGLVLILAVVSSIAAAQDEPRVGTWELNLAMSTFRPGPPPRKQTLTFQAAGPHWTALLQGIDASGQPINPDVNNLVINFDGRDHPTANVDYDTTAWERTKGDRYSYEAIRKKAGKVVLISKDVVSKDGRTMTITTKGVSANGQSVDNVRVYDKQ